MTKSGGFVIGFEAFDSRIRIECFDSEIRDMLDRYIFPPLRRCTPAPDPAAIDIRLEPFADCIHIVLNDKSVARSTTVAEAVLSTIKALDGAVVQRMKSLHAVHAGAVLIDGRALLLPGSTHSGKSSLVTELLRCGAACFSDEYALLDDKGLVHPYPRPLLPRDGHPQQSLLLPEDLGSKYAETTAPVGWVLATEFDSAASWDVHQISQSEAVMFLSQNTPHAMSESPNLLDIFVRAVADAICVRGKRGEAARAAEEILQLVAGSGFRLGIKGC